MPPLIGANAKPLNARQIIQDTSKIPQIIQDISKIPQIIQKAPPLTHGLNRLYNFEYMPALKKAFEKNGGKNKVADFFFKHGFKIDQNARMERANYYIAELQKVCPIFKEFKELYRSEFFSKIPGHLSADHPFRDPYYYQHYALLDLQKILSDSLSSILQDKPFSNKITQLHSTKEIAQLGSIEKNIRQAVAGTINASEAMAIIAKILLHKTIENNKDNNLLLNSQTISPFLAISSLLDLIQQTIQAISDDLLFTEKEEKIKFDVGLKALNAMRAEAIAKLKEIMSDFDKLYQAAKFTFNPDIVDLLTSFDERYISPEPVPRNLMPEEKPLTRLAFVLFLKHKDAQAALAPDNFAALYTAGTESFDGAVLPKEYTLKAPEGPNNISNIRKFELLKCHSARLTQLIDKAKDSSSKRPKSLPKFAENALPMIEGIIKNVTNFDAKDPKMKQANQAKNRLYQTFDEAIQEAEKKNDTHLKNKLTTQKNALISYVISLQTNSSILCRLKKSFKAFSPFSKLMLKWDQEIHPTFKQLYAIKEISDQTMESFADTLNKNINNKENVDNALQNNKPNNKQGTQELKKAQQQQLQSFFVLPNFFDSAFWEAVLAYLNYRETEKPTWLNNQASPLEQVIQIKCARDKEVADALIAKINQLRVLHNEEKLVKKPTATSSTLSSASEKRAQQNTT